MISYLPQLPIEIIEFSTSKNNICKPRIPHVRGALKRGVRFSIEYGPSMSSSEGRKNFFSNLRQLLILARNHGIIVTSSARIPEELMSPTDVVNMFIPQFS